MYYIIKIYLSPSSWWYDKVRGDAMISEILIPRHTVTGLNFVFASEVIQCSLSDVNTTETKIEKTVELVKFKV